MNVATCATLAQSSDVNIMEEARANRETIVTHDLDYGHLLAFSGEAAPSVIIFHLRNTHPDNLFARIVSTWSEIEKPLVEGAVVALEDATLRIRRLPHSSVRIKVFARAHRRLALSLGLRSKV